MRPLVISLGGSVVVPQGKPDVAFLQQFGSFARKLARKRKLVIVTGGGVTARNYIEAARKAKLSQVIQDKIGITATRLNAQLLIAFLGIKQEIPQSIAQTCNLAKKQRITIAGGMMPSTTTDGIAALIAASLKAELINMTNVAGLYNKDPAKYKNAKLIRKISSKEFLKKVSKIKEKPGQHFILDMLAAKTIAKHKIKAVILGKNLQNLQSYLKGKSFVGTVIIP